MNFDFSSDDLKNMINGYISEMNQKYVGHEIIFTHETDGFTSCIYLNFEGNKICVFDEEFDTLITNDFDDSTIEKEEYTIKYYFLFKEMIVKNVKETFQKMRYVYSVIKIDK